jgi:hypothetical protein
MSSIKTKFLIPPFLAAAGLIGSTPVLARQAAQPAPLTVQEQGSFAVGGTVVNTPGIYNHNKPIAEGQSLHGDHLYAFYQVPETPKTLPVVMLHGTSCSSP